MSIPSRLSLLAFYISILTKRICISLPFFYSAHNHPSYRVFRAGAAHKPMTTSPTAPVLAVPTLPRENGCLESWLGEGRLGEGCEIGGAATLEPKLDAVWTWVNG